MQWADSLFDRWSFDLMFGREGQSVQAWEAELREALRFGSKHLSLYQLTLEPNTTFYTRAQHGRLALPSPDAQADMYDTTLALCAEQGLERYEISSFAMAGQECRHNLNYWVYGDYLGVGAGAHGRVTVHNAKIATTQVALPEKWLANVSEGSLGYHEWRDIPSHTQIEEALILGLRTTRGFPLQRFISIAGGTPQHYFGNRLDALVNDGLLTYDETVIKATPKGLAFLNTIETRLFI
jgi:oxygen-independent coproporphyrinogen-3 oxidase